MSFNVSWVYQAIDKFTPVARRVQRAAQNVKTKMDGFSKANVKTGMTLDKLQLQMAKFAAVAATLFLLAMPIQQAIAFEAKMADIAKVVDFERPTGLLMMSKDIQELSKRIPLAQSGLAEIAAAGGQFGIAEKDIIKFTETVSKMAVAFDLLPSQAGLAVAKLSNIFEIPVDEFEGFADKINFVSNKTASSAEELIRALQNKAAGAGRIMGFTAEETLGLTSTFIQLGVNANRVGSILDSMSRRLTDTSIVGEAFAKKFAAAPQKSLIMLLGRIKQLKGVAKATALKELFGEFSGRIGLLADTMDDKLIPTLHLVTKAQGAAGSVQKEFANRTATTDAQMEIFKNRLRNIGINIGSALLPALNSLMSIIGFGADMFARFVDATGPLIPMLLGAAAALLLIKLAVIAWTIAQGALNIALFANPIGLIIAAIAAAIIGIGWLIKKIEELGGVTAVFSMIGNAIIDHLLFPLRTVLQAIDAITGTDLTSKLDAIISTIKFDVPDKNITTGGDKSETEINVNVNAPPGIVKSVEATSRGPVTPKVGQNMLLVN